MIKRNLNMFSFQFGWFGWSAQLTPGSTPDVWWPDNILARRFNEQLSEKWVLVMTNLCVSLQRALMLMSFTEKPPAEGKLYTECTLYEFQNNTWTLHFTKPFENMVLNQNCFFLPCWPPHVSFPCITARLSATSCVFLTTWKMLSNRSQDFFWLWYVQCSCIALCI